MKALIVHCDYAQEFEEGDICPHAGQISCVTPLCPMLETGRATLEEIEEDDFGL